MAVSISTTFLKAVAMAVIMMMGMMCILSSTASADCMSVLPGLTKECKQFVQPGGPNVPPSPACCTIAKTVDIPCFCQHVTPELEKMVDPKKVLFVADKCGLKAKAGMKCGSFTIPPM